MYITIFKCLEWIFFEKKEKKRKTDSNVCISDNASIKSEMFPCRNCETKSWRHFPLASLPNTFITL